MTRALVGVALIFNFRRKIFFDAKLKPQLEKFRSNRCSLGGGHKYFFIVSAQRTLFHQKHFCSPGAGANYTFLFVILAQRT